MVPGLAPSRRLWRARLLLAPVWLSECLRTAVAPKRARHACTSLMLARSQVLAAVLGERPVFHSRLLPQKGETLVGWGRKWSGRRAAALAKHSGRDLLLVEDGFLRSVGRHDSPLSLLMDRIGCHYDATQPSELEELIQSDLNEAERARARAIMAAWRTEGLSKYNAQRNVAFGLPDRYVLVCDQTFGDLSIEYGMATAASFSRMLEAALAEYPDHTILLKTHPDVKDCARRGHFDPKVFGASDRVRVLTDPVHPAGLIPQAEVVYTVTSQLGFEALIWGRPVRCFGMPFYGGWGLTEDDLPAPERRRPVALEQIAHAALVRYPRYVDPLSRRICEPERAFAHVGLQRRRRQELPARIAAVGFSRWKRHFVACFLQGSEVTFQTRRQAERTPAETEAVAIWGDAEVPVAHSDKPVLRLEDGFLRSSGLGAELVRPQSLVVDDVGIYFDATRPSRLERILQTENPDNVALRRASELRDRIVRLDLTKYNLGRETWQRPTGKRPVLLVVGQVESDASIRLGSPVVRSNFELLARVRAENPDACIVYKPHPDVLAGLRRGGMQEDAAHVLADEILTRPVSPGHLFTQIDAVHTMTSLMGFEALLRGVPVVCHGLPFYAGWGLTEDRLSCPRRNRKLTLDALVHGALIAYPRYFDYRNNCFVEPEDAVGRLAELAGRGPQTAGWQRRLLRLAVRSWIGLTGNTR
ncbi:capsular polysaccharide biosynthesis protein [Tabrizicola sp. YIM 78059]|uniref:capsular polysaccharide biosynthesis protein n=1 Tax=Tabrizicola sp. YIM 78059 TaxID=2529861 RepID=UPI0010AA3AFB|nr:capsular polysaccharide biosynthesis protein [Tabrizicola sp. YIM 78059]